MEKIPLAVITGPTASGKTDAAIEAAKVLNGEIVSADSMQIYRYMDIGTAKPTFDERQGIQHHLVDIVNPDEEYSVALFQHDAVKSIFDISCRGKLPILAGGTGLYINSVTYPMNFTSAAEDPEYRDYLNELSMRHGKLYMHEMLQSIDPETASRLHPNDLRRIIRALEVFHMTGKTMSDYRQDFNTEETPFRLVMIGLTMERQRLYERINLRADMMVESGLVDEVKGLLDMGYSENLTSMQGLGYKEIVTYLKGLTTLAEALETLKRNTRRFAKRQLTWFRRDNRIEWVETDKYSGRHDLTEHITELIKEKLCL